MAEAVDVGRSLERWLGQALGPSCGQLGLGLPLAATGDVVAELAK